MLKDDPPMHGTCVYLESATIMMSYSKGLFTFFVGSSQLRIGP